MIPSNFTLPLATVEAALKTGTLKALATNGNWWLCRRNGKTQRWVTRPTEYRIPIKLGFHGHTIITHESLFCRPGDGNRTGARFLIEDMMPEGAKSSGPEKYSSYGTPKVME